VTLEPRVAWPPTRVESPAAVTCAAIVSAVACCLFFHGYQIFNFPLSVDEELNLGGENVETYLQHGRWGLALRTWLLMPDTTVPIAATATGLALYGAAFVLLIRHYRIQHWVSVAVAAPMFFGFPVLLYGIAFANIALTLGLGAFVGVLALISAEHMRLARFILATCVVAFAVSLYQSLLYFVIVIFAADLVRRIWPADRPMDREERQRFLWYAGVVLGGVALYALIAFLFLEAFGLHLAYITQFVKPEQLGANGIGVVKATLMEAGRLYAGAAPTFLHRNVFYRILIGLCATLLLWRLVATGLSSLPLAVLVAGSIVLILAAPFLQHPLNGGTLPYRTLIGLPAAAAVLALFAAEISPSALRSWILLPLAVLVAIEFSWINNRQYYAGYWSLERDKVIGAEMLSRIRQILPAQDSYTVTVVGKLRRKHDALIPAVPTSTLGRSFFEWDGGSPERVAAFLNFLSDAKFSPATAEQTLAALEASGPMPPWPATNSIARMGDVVVIKLSRPTAEQLQQFCRSADTGLCAGHRP
jgi:Glucosyl transferase GtrII